MNTWKKYIDETAGTRMLPRVGVRPHVTGRTPAELTNCPIKSQSIGHYLFINGKPAACKCPPAVEPTTEKEN